jgi:hypothetical protein
MVYIINGGTIMAYFSIPLDEAVYVLKKSIELNDYIKDIESTDDGPRLTIKYKFFLFHILIRFVMYDQLRGIAHFKLDGIIPKVINLDHIIRDLPEGVNIVGDNLLIEILLLLRTQLSISCLSVQNIEWNDNSFQINTEIS